MKFTARTRPGLQKSGEAELYLDARTGAFRYVTDTTDAAIGGTGGGGGVTDHAALTSLTWASSGHTGTASRLAGFSGAGVAAYYQIGVDVQAWDADLDAFAAGTYTIAATKGGTGLTSYAEGDTLYASATNTIAKLAAPTSGQRAGKVLGWSGDTLAWVAPLLVGVIGGRDIIVEARAVYDVPGCTTVERP